VTAAAEPAPNYGITAGSISAYGGGVTARGDDAEIAPHN
jgi:hypothetical protein